MSATPSALSPPRPWSQGSVSLALPPGNGVPVSEGLEKLRRLSAVVSAITDEIDVREKQLDKLKRRRTNAKEELQEAVLDEAARGRHPRSAIAEAANMLSGSLYYLLDQHGETPKGRRTQGQG